MASAKEAEVFSSPLSGWVSGVDGREPLDLRAYSWAGSVGWARGCHGTPGLNSGMSASDGVGGAPVGVAVIVLEPGGAGAEVGVSTAPPEPIDSGGYE